MSHKKRRLVDETSQTTSSSSNARNTREEKVKKSNNLHNPTPHNQFIYLNMLVNLIIARSKCLVLIYLVKVVYVNGLSYIPPVRCVDFRFWRKLHQNQLQMIQPITFHFSQYPLTATLTPWEMLLFRTILLMPLQTINLHHECIILDLVRFHHQALPLHH